MFLSSREKRISSFFEIPVLIAAVLVIPTILIEQSSLSDGWITFANYMNWVIWIVFVAESAMLLSASKNKKQWLLHHPLDIAIVLLTSPINPPFLQSGRILRLLRLVRLVRLIKITQMVNKLFSVRGLAWAGFLSFIVVIGGGLAFTIVEKGQHLTEWDGVYWAMTTVTTVGSTITPLTTPGRILTITILLVGTGFVAVLTAAVAERFMRYAKAENKLAASEEEILRQLKSLNKRLEEMEKKIN